MCRDLFIILNRCLVLKFLTEVIFTITLLLGSASSSELSDRVLNLKPFLFFLLLLSLLFLVFEKHGVNLLLLEEGDALEEDIKVHFYNFRFPHELQVGDLFFRKLVLVDLSEEDVGSRFDVLSLGCDHFDLL